MHVTEFATRYESVCLTIILYEDVGMKIMVLIYITAFWYIKNVSMALDLQ